MEMGMGLKLMGMGSNGKDKRLSCTPLIISRAVLIFIICPASYQWRRLLCFHYVPLSQCQHELVHRASEYITHMQRRRHHMTVRGL